ncbi:MAG: succinate-semialdehyde dehydrogenase [Chitinophagales bacterium]|nr:MAG: succinate-semialdehyde dehydrogenase [Chitinophagales bacterium]
MRFFSTNPFDNKVVKKISGHSLGELQDILRRAVQEYETWKKTPVISRSKYLQSVAAILRAEKSRWASLITLEMGKPIKEAEVEIEKCALVCDFYSEKAPDWLNDEKIPSEASSSFISYEPLGVVLGIMPWNFPFWQVFRFAVPAIAAGNVVLLKHASNVPQCALAIQEIFQKAQPGYIFQTLLINNRRVRRVIEHPAVKMVSLTGSDRAGAEVAALAGRNIKKTVMELGGSDPFIVLEDANLKSAAETGLRSRMQNAGQSCIAAKRFIVVPEVRDKFIEMMAELISKIKVGNPADPATEMGPLASENQARAVMKQIQQSVRAGAKIVIGGKRLSGKGAFVQPTLLVNVKPGMPVFDEEVFGPVACVVDARDGEEAIQLANKTHYGLGASLWSEDIEKATRYVRLINAGNVFINAMVRSDPRFPFGGINRSGYGRELSIHGLREFVNIKTVWIT